MQKLLFIGILLLFVQINYCKAIPVDKSEIKKRTADQELLEKFKNDPSLKYIEAKQEGISLWDRFWMKVFELFRKLFSDEGYAPLIRYSIIALLFAGLAYLVFTKQIQAFFYAGGKKKKIKFSEINENIHGIDFETLIAESKAAGNYRKAVRYLFLKSLKELDDLEKIDWTIEKTNTDYYLEIQRKEEQFTFKKLTRIYEYAWYGEFNIASTDYMQFESDFNAFQSTLSPKR